MNVWKGICFADRRKVGRWVRMNGESVSGRLGRFVDHPPLVDRLKEMVVSTYGAAGSPNPRNTLELLERALEKIASGTPLGREQARGLVERLERREGTLYSAIREEGGL